MSFKTFKNNLLNNPLPFNIVRSILLAGKGKMYKELRNTIAPEKGSKVLDVGCGTGEFALLFDNSVDYTGIDMNTGFLDYASNLYKHQNKKFVQMDATKMSFKKSEFDTSLLLSFIHHFSEEDLDKILKEVNRITQKSIFVLEPIPRKYNLLSKIFYALDRGDFIRKKEEQLRILSKYFNVVSYKEFKSGLYTLSILQCSPKALKE